jgi:hypothetical protein
MILPIFFYLMFTYGSIHLIDTYGRLHMSQYLDWRLKMQRKNKICPYQGEMCFFNQGYK